MGPDTKQRTGSPIYSQEREMSGGAKRWFFLLFLCVSVFYIIYTMSHSGIIMSEEDVQELYRLIFSWLDHQEDFSHHLRELANELESVNRLCNAGCAVGNTVTAIGGVALIGTGFATSFGVGNKAPLAKVAGMGALVGPTVTVVSKVLEPWLERITLENAKKISEEYKRLGEEINEQIGRIKGGSGLAVADDKVIQSILQAIAKKNEIPWQEVVEKVKEWMLQTATAEMTKGSPESLKPSWSEGAQDILSGFNILRVTVPDAIKNYEKAINDNSVTGSSEELKKAADELEKSTQKIRAALNDIEKKMIKIWHRKYFYSS